MGTLRAVSLGVAGMGRVSGKLGGSSTVLFFSCLSGIFGAVSSICGKFAGFVLQSRIPGEPQVSAGGKLFTHMPANTFEIGPAVCERLTLFLACMPS